MDFHPSETYSVQFREIISTEEEKDVIADEFKSRKSVFASVLADFANEAISGQEFVDSKEIGNPLKRKDLLKGPNTENEDYF